MDEFYNMMKRRPCLCARKKWEAFDASNQKPESWLLQASHKGPKQRKEKLPWITSMMLLQDTQGGEEQLGEPSDKGRLMSLEAGAGQQTTLSLDTKG